MSIVFKVRLAVSTRSTWLFDEISVLYVEDVASDLPGQISGRRNPKRLLDWKSAKSAKSNKSTSHCGFFDFTFHWGFDSFYIRQFATGLHSEGNRTALDDPASSQMTVNKRSLASRTASASLGKSWILADLLQPPRPMCSSPAAPRAFQRPPRVFRCRSGSALGGKRKA